MDTQTFLNNLKDHVERLKDLLPGPKSYMNEIFDYLDTNYEVYINLAPEGRATIRSFIKDNRYDSPHGDITYYAAYLLLMYVKERVIPSLKPPKKVSMWNRLKGMSESPDDIVRLLRGLVAISMENNAEKFPDASYGYGVSAMVLLADLYVTAEERGIKPKRFFQQIANISGNDGIEPMQHMMASGGDSRLRAERRHFGQFEGAF